MILVYYSKWLCLGAGATCGSSSECRKLFSTFRESMPKLTRFAFKLDAVPCGIKSHPWLRFKLDDSITVSSCEFPRYCGKNSAFLNVYGAKILGSRVVSISFFIQRIAMTQRVAVTARRSHHSGCLFSPHAKFLPSHSSPHRLLPN